MSPGNQHLSSIGPTSHPTSQLANRTLFRSPQARHDLHRDLQTKWYYKKVSSIHNGALVRQEYRVTYLEPPIPIGVNYDPQDLLNQLDWATASVDNRLSMPPLPPMGLPSLPFQTCDPSSGIGCSPSFSFLTPTAQEPPPPYTPVQPSVTTVNRPTQFNFIDGTPGGAVNLLPFQGQPVTGNTAMRDNRALANGYNVTDGYNFGPAIPNQLCNCPLCRGAGQ